MDNNPKYNPQIHHRRSIRLKGFDYSQGGLYFITICCQNKQCLFGSIENGLMTLNHAGEIANQCWKEIPNHFPKAIPHDYVIMPNHIHGIIELQQIDNVPNVGVEDFRHQPPTGVEDFLPLLRPPTGVEDFLPLLQPPTGVEDFLPLLPKQNAFQQPIPLSIASIVKGFKIGVTKWFRSNTEIYAVWQRNYYEHVIRSQESYQNISAYILNNPSNWHQDKFYK